VQLWPDGSFYIGMWHQGQASRYGRFALADGDCYEGDWDRDKAHGRYGTYYYIDGARYEGEWREDRQEGRGLEKWPDGS
jgi:MORN repeat